MWQDAKTDISIAVQLKSRKASFKKIKFRDIQIPQPVNLTGKLGVMNKYYYNM